jgi:hypothetical protein
MDGIRMKIMCVENRLKVLLLKNKHKMKTRLHVRKINLRELRQKGNNILVIGPSVSRKNQCIQDILGSHNSITVRTSYPDLWPSHKSVRLTNSMSRIVDAKGARVIEDIEDPNIFGCLVAGPDSDVINIVGIPSLNQSVGRYAKMFSHLILLGGLQDLEKVWNDFGALFPKYRDFHQIYLACTDEGDRYSDDFLIVSLFEDQKNLLQWSSLRREPPVDITLEIDSFVAETEDQFVEEPVKKPVKKSAKERVEEPAKELVKEPIEEPIEEPEMRIRRKESLEFQPQEEPQRGSENQKLRAKAEEDYSSQPVEELERKSENQAESINSREPRAECVIC